MHRNRSITTAKMKNIFFIINIDWFFLSHRLQLALAMKNLGYGVYILTRDSGRSAEIESYGLKFINIDFDRSGKNPLVELSSIYKILKLMKKHSPEIVHNVTIKPALYGSIASKFYGKPNVVNAISGLGYNFIGNRQGLVQKILRKLMDFAFAKDVNFIFQNPDDMNLYKQMGYLKRNRYKLIKGAGVDSDDFNYHAPMFNDKLQVVLIARMLSDKGVLEFAQAARILKPRWNKKVLFRLIGDIDSFNPAGLAESDLRSLESPDYLVWEGFREDIKSILIGADIVCLPSYREGLPKSLIEAMAIGRPIVTTDVPGCRECVEQNYNGFLVPSQNSELLAEALERLLSNSELRGEMGRNSRSKMERELSLQKVIADTKAFYEEIQQ